MPTYSIDGPDGKTYSIDGPAGATREQVIAKIKERQGGTVAAPEQRGVVDKLFGLTGERYQTWPEKLVRGIAGAVETGGELTKKALTGEYGPTGEKIAQEDPGKILAASSLGVGAAPAASLGKTAAIAAKESRLRTEMPGVSENVASAKAAYKQIEDARLQTTPQATAEFSATTKAMLDDEHLIVPENAPSTFRALDKIEKSDGNIAKIMAMYSALGRVKPSAGTDYAAASIVREQLGQFIENLTADQVIAGDPAFTKAMWDQARSTWRVAKNLETIEEAQMKGERRAAIAGTGANIQNAMRQRLNELLSSEKKSRSMSDEAKAKLEQIVMGTGTANVARRVGKFAPSGPVSAMGTIGADIIAGPKVATGVAAMALISKYFGEWLTRRQIRELEQLIKEESPLGAAAKKRIEAEPAGAIPRALDRATPVLIPGSASGLASAGQ